MREKPPWCNPLPTLAPSLSLPLFLRVETKTDGLPAATRPPRARKYDYAALRDPRITALPSPPSTRLSSTRPPFFPFLASPGGPFTAAARFAQVAFEVGSRPKAGWSR